MASFSVGTTVSGSRIWARTPLIHDPGSLRVSRAEWTRLDGVACQKLRIQRANTYDLLREMTGKPDSERSRAADWDPLFSGSERTVSSSHKENAVAIAVSGGAGRVGVDIEDLGSSDLPLISGGALSLLEHRNLQRFQQRFHCDLSRATLIYWTVKEAAQKCMGYFPDMKEIAVVLVQDEVKVLCGNKVMTGSVWLFENFVLSCVEENR